MPVHTIVWAKEFYKLLFGEKVEESMLFEDPNGEEPSTYMESVLAFRQILQDGNAADKKPAAKTLIQKFYLDEIQKQLDMDRYKTAQKTPVPLDIALIEVAVNRPAPSSTGAYKQTDIPTQADCIAEFVACLEEAQTGQVLPSFDKDDMLSMRFVTATSDLRSYVFGIEPIQSFYSAKGIAGNIIPAIATTNAIAAGLQILQTFHILKQQLASGAKTGGHGESCKYINIIREKTRNGQYLTAATLEPPNPKCYVCRKNTLLLSINTESWTFQEFLDNVIKKDLGFAEPSVMIEGNYVWEEGEGADVESFAANAAMTLSSLPYGGIKDGTTILIDDFSQELEVEIAVSHKEVWEKEDDEAGEEDDKYRFRFGGAKPFAAASKSDAANGADETTKSSGKVEEDDDDDDDDAVVEIVNELVDGDDSEKKRPANGTVDAGPLTKKAKVVSADGGDDVIEVDD
jgi:ubiquitin-like 1-activating enzyme E1 B